MKENPIIIIGSGLAGYLFAKEFRKLNTTTALEIITSSDGNFYSKPLLSTALTQKKTPEELMIYDANVMAAQLNATIYTHTNVESIDPQAKTVTTHHQEKLPYSELILACGSYPIHLRLTGTAVQEVVSVNDLHAYAVYRNWLANKKNIAILGSGLVGCEFANDLINTNHNVEIISLDKYPLAKFVPPPIGEILQQAFAQKGVKWHMQQSAVSVDHIGNGVAVTTKDGAQITTDGVFSAVGIKPVIDLAKSAQLKIDRAIVVNRHLQTSEKNIYALGDCAQVDNELRQYVAPIMQCARVLAANLNGQPVTVTYEPMPIMVKTSICPIVAIPPVASVVGQWQMEANNHHAKALFYDQEQRLRGFALTGEATKQRVELTKQLL